jgi:hypothetical protein
MSQQLDEDVAPFRYWPRSRKLPRCEACSDLMVTPEASVFRPDGKVSYLWSCDGKKVHSRRF